MMSGQLPEYDAAIAAFYRQADEVHRLEEGPFLLEALRTRELIERHARPAPATVLDIGGAGGAYALWMAAAGYTVHLLDAAAHHVAEAERRSAVNQRPLASCVLGDARRLPFADGCADVALLLGPLYHLTTAADRMMALREAARVLKPEGVLFAAAISRCGSVLDGLARELFDDPRFEAMAEQDMRDGQHRNATERLDYFTTAYFHRPEELRAEVAGAGFEVSGLYGIEGPGWILPDLAARLEDPRRIETVLRVARLLESDPSVQGASAHLLAVGRKPRQ